MTELPRAWMNRMRNQLRDEMPAFLNAMEEPGLRGIRFNPRKTFPERERWPDAEAPVPWEKNGFYLKRESTAGTTVWHEAGAFYLQEPSAMLPAAVLNAQPGEWVLDLCAAPGGKATQIGLALNGEGLLVANEPVEKRARILNRNIERMGIPNAVVTCERPNRLAEKWPGLFDAVMVDAPCSGEGMFRREPESRTEWSPEAAEGCVRRQREILQAAALLVRPGGRLVYSTCTFNPEENEGNVCWFLDNHPEFRPEAFSLQEISGREGCFTYFPHRLRGEGQFAALLRRSDGENRKNKELAVCGLRPADLRQIKMFKEAFPALLEPTHMLGETLVHLPAAPELKGIRVLRAGLHLGEIRGKTLIPDHAAAMSFRLSEEAERTALSPEDALRFLAGETLNMDGRGWVIPTVRDLALGWGKISDGICKNHYPKGLRNSLLHL